MKPLWSLCTLSFCCLLFAPLAMAESSVTEENSSTTLLADMSTASRSLNYELSYININKQGVESLRYRHTRQEQLTLAQLLYLDGPRREVLQRGDEISYFEPGLEPFTLAGEHIVDAMPTVVFANFQQLQQYYDFISVGRARLADRLCEVLRIVARDGTRYSFVVWLDTETKLPLRVDLLDSDGDTLEQYRVIAFTVGPDVLTAMNSLNTFNLPPLFPLPITPQVDFAWRPLWLPQGVREVSRSLRTLPGLMKPVESRLYSDGLFSFSINVGAVDNSNEQSLRQGRRVIYTGVRDNSEITVVGELPTATAKRIVDSVALDNKRKP